jgi:hypothetical protein
VIGHLQRGLLLVEKGEPAGYGELDKSCKPPSPGEKAFPSQAPQKAY